MDGHTEKATFPNMKICRKMQLFMLVMMLQIMMIKIFLIIMKKVQVSVKMLERPVSALYC